MERLTDLLKDTLQNLSGKDLTGNYVTLDELLKDFNNKYICEVTFSKTPSGATIVVKQNGVVINPDASGKYHLKEGSYTYDASAAHYTSKTNQALTITNADETTGSKTVNVTLDRADCEVTFSTTPENATIVVKDSESETVNPDASGKYYLVAGSYTYTASAEGYVTKADQTLTIAAGDVTTGTKTVTVELSAEEVTG